MFIGSYSFLYVVVALLSRIKPVKKFILINSLVLILVVSKVIVLGLNHETNLKNTYTVYPLKHLSWCQNK